MNFARGFGMMITAGVLCAYHSAWYDGAVLIIPFGLAITQGSRVLRIVSTGLILLPFWNAMPAFVSALLLIFCLLYSDAKSWTRGAERPEKEVFLASA
jgi:hypothetical protein